MYDKGNMIKDLYNIEYSSRPNCGVKNEIR